MAVLPLPPGTGVERPLVLLALPVAAALVAWLVLRGGGTASRRVRWALFGSRLVVVACLVVAAAGPYSVATTAAAGDPRVTMLVDRSASTAVAPAVADDLERAVEARGVRVSRSTVAAGNRSRIGDGVIANLRANGSLLLLSDGRVTGGRSLSAAAEAARGLDATVNAVALDPNRTERHVAVHGPATTSVDVGNRFGVVVEGVSEGPSPADLVVSVDGEVVERAGVTGERTSVTVRRNFSTTGSHRVTARLRGDDRFAVNDVARHTVDVVEKPSVLYVGGDYPLGEYLSRLYDVERADAVPAELDPYYAVVLQNRPADRAGNVTALQRFVLEGNGLVVAGGERAFEHGNYSASPLGALVPVRPGEGGGRRTRIVLAVDVSGSASGGMAVQKALALDVLDQLGDRNAVGVVAFDGRAHRIARPRPLGPSRDALARKIRRLTTGGGTSIAAGLEGAATMLDGPGTVVLISDGRADRGTAVSAARTLAARDVRVISVGVGRSAYAPVLRAVADAGGGTYLRANGTSRLRILFGDDERRYRGRSLTVVDGSHFVTAGVRLTARLPFTNDVAVKRGASFLAATGAGDPAVAAWRYATGRVVAVTAHGNRGGLDGLLSRPDSLLVSKSVNWAIGDPRRKARRRATVPDTRVGRPTTVVYRGDERPEPGNRSLSFSRAGSGRYEATLRPARRGYRTLLGTEYAVDYREEYAGFGPSPALSTLVTATGGRTFEPDAAAAVARAVARQSRHVREVRTDWAPAAVLAALVAFVVEVAARRLAGYRTEGIP